MTKSVLVSGIQPSGRLHIGNYLGALKNFVDLQNSGKYQCYFFIADLHSLTEEQNIPPREKAARILELTADYLATGLNPKRSIIFQQSQIPAHTELSWIFETQAVLGKLARMTQYKEKIMRVYGKATDEVVDIDPKLRATVKNVGLLTYPVLMAADILLYDAKYVPVGEDQLQHLELARTLARKFNKKFPARRSLGEGRGKTFVEPQPILTSAPRVMSLADPHKKMSKSDPASCLFLDDAPEEIKKKVMRATTDSGKEIKYDEAKKPGISNLLQIYASLEHRTIEHVERQYADKTYSEFKSDLAGVISDHFADFRKKKKSLLAKPALLRQALRHGSGQAAKIANRKIAEVKKKIGIAI